MILMKSTVSPSLSLVILLLWIGVGMVRLPDLPPPALLCGDWTELIVVFFYKVGVGEGTVRAVLGVFKTSSQSATATL